MASFAYNLKFVGDTGEADTLGLMAPVRRVMTDGKKMSARALLTAEVRDRQGDVVIVSGMDLSGHELNPVALIDHGKSYGLPIGVCRTPEGLYTVEAGDGEIWQETYFSQRSQMAEQVYALIEEGILAGNSAGFRPIEWEELDDDPEQGFRSSHGREGYKPAGKLITRSELCECSWATIPVNQEAARAAVCKSWGGRSLAPAIVEAWRPWLPSRKPPIVRGGYSSPLVFDAAAKAWGYAEKGDPRNHLPKLLANRRTEGGGYLAPHEEQGAFADARQRHGDANYARRTGQQYAEPVHPALESARRGLHTVAPNAGAKPKEQEKSLDAGPPEERHDAAPEKHPPHHGPKEEGPKHRPLTFNPKDHRWEKPNVTHPATASVEVPPVQEDEPPLRGAEARAEKVPVLPQGEVEPQGVTAGDDEARAAAVKDAEALVGPAEPLPKDEPSLLEAADRKAAGIIARVKKSMAALAEKVGGEVAPHVGEVGTWLFDAYDWCKKKAGEVYDGLVKRYGPKTALAVVASGTVLGWGVTIGSTALTGIPILIPGMSAVLSMPAAAAAEVYYQLRGKHKKKDAGGTAAKAWDYLTKASYGEEDDSTAELEKIAREEAEALMAAFAEWVKENPPPVEKASGEKSWRVGKALPPVGDEVSRADRRPASPPTPKTKPAAARPASETPLAFNTKDHKWERPDHPVGAVEPRPEGADEDVNPAAVPPSLAPETMSTKKPEPAETPAHEKVKPASDKEGERSDIHLYKPPPPPPEPSPEGRERIDAARAAITGKRIDDMKHEDVRRIGGLLMGMSHAELRRLREEMGIDETGFKGKSKSDAADKLLGRYHAVEAGEKLDTGGLPREENAAAILRDPSTSLLQRNAILDELDHSQMKKLGKELGVDPRPVSEGGNGFEDEAYGKRRPGAWRRMRDAILSEMGERTHRAQMEEPNGVKEPDKLYRSPPAEEGEAGPDEGVEYPDLRRLLPSSVWKDMDRDDVKLVFRKMENFRDLKDSQVRALIADLSREIQEGLYPRPSAAAELSALRAVLAAREKKKAV